MGPSSNKRYKLKTNERATMTIKHCKPKHLSVELSQAKVTEHLDIKQKNIQTKVSNFKTMATKSAKEEITSREVNNKFVMYERRPNSFHYGDSSSSRTSLAYSLDACKSSLHSFHADSFDESISSLCRCYPPSVMKSIHSQYHMPSRSLYNQLNSWKYNEDTISKTRIDNFLVNGRARQFPFSNDAEKIMSSYTSSHMLDQTNKGEIKMQSARLDDAPSVVECRPKENKDTGQSSSHLKSLLREPNNLPLFRNQTKSCCRAEHPDLSNLIEIHADQNDNEEPNDGDKEENNQVKIGNLFESNFHFVKSEVNQRQCKVEETNAELVILIQKPGNGDGNEKFIRDVSIDDHQPQPIMSAKNLSGNYPYSEGNDDSIIETTIINENATIISEEAVTKINDEVKDLKIVDEEQSSSSKEKVILKDSSSQLQFEDIVALSQKLSNEKMESLDGEKNDDYHFKSQKPLVANENSFENKFQNLSSKVIEALNKDETTDDVKVDHKPSLLLDVHSKSSTDIEQKSISQKAAFVKSIDDVVPNSSLQQSIEYKSTKDVEHESNLLTDVECKDTKNVEHEPNSYPTPQSNKDIEIVDQKFQFQEDMQSQNSANMELTSYLRQEELISNPDLIIEAKASNLEQDDQPASTDPRPSLCYSNESENSVNTYLRNNFQENEFKSKVSIIATQSSISQHESQTISFKNDELKSPWQENLIDYEYSSPELKQQFDYEFRKTDIIEQTNQDLNFQQKVDARNFNPSVAGTVSQPDLVRIVSETKNLTDVSKKNSELKDISVIHQNNLTKENKNSPSDLIEIEKQTVDKENAAEINPFNSSLFQIKQEFSKGFSDLLSTINVNLQTQNRHSERNLHQYKTENANSSSFIAPNEGQLPLPPWVEPIYAKNTQPIENLQLDSSNLNFNLERAEQEDPLLNPLETANNSMMDPKEETENNIRAYQSYRDNQLPNHQYPTVLSSKHRCCIGPHNNIPFEPMSCASCCCHAYNDISTNINPCPMLFQVCPVFPLYVNHAVEMACYVPNRAPSIPRIPYNVSVIPFPSSDFPTLNHNGGIHCHDNINGRSQNRFEQFEIYDRNDITNGLWNNYGHSNIRPARLRSDKAERFDNSSRNADSQRPSTSRGTSHRPFVICHICGREFGRASISIHEKQCLQKWQTGNNLPKHMQRKEPVKPHVLSQHETGRNLSDDTASKIPGAGKASYNLDNLNDAAFAFSQAQNIKCDKCGRTFALDRLGVHRKNCCGFHKIM